MADYQTLFEEPRTIDALGATGFTEAELAGMRSAGIILLVRGLDPQRMLCRDDQVGTNRDFGERGEQLRVECHEGPALAYREFDE